MQEMQLIWLLWLLGQEDPLEEGIAPHFSVLVWEISWAEEPGRLQSMGVSKSQTWLSTHTHTSMFALSKFLKKIKAVLFHKSQGVREELQVSKNWGTSPITLQQKLSDWSSYQMREAHSRSSGNVCWVAIRMANIWFLIQLVTSNQTCNSFQNISSVVPNVINCSIFSIEWLSFWKPNKSKSKI